MRKATEDGLEFIKSHEALRLDKYTCPAGQPTIGYGHVVKPTEDFTKISKRQAEKILSKDLESAERAVLNNIYVDLDDNQFDALVSFTFNLGSAALQRSTLRQKINRLEYDDAAEEFKRWVYARGAPLAGLIRRRDEEAQMFLGVLILAKY